MREFYNRLIFEFGKGVPYLISDICCLSATVFLTSEILYFLENRSPFTFYPKNYSLFCKIFVSIIVLHFSLRRTSTIFQTVRQTTQNDVLICFSMGSVEELINMSIDVLENTMEYFF